MELSLYRKYRPQGFEDLVGQEHIKQTIENALRESSLAHAYLFCGPRGTGKTTVARLLAKALLCEKGPTASPDGTCDQCVEIAEGNHPDVHELDAASRTGVDAVRDEIISRVQFAPTQGAYKVYIIDEVHMLSTAAFNALLKTLEEPPAHVVFIMCTTHPHKVPDTIQSRCQRFDFQRIPTKKIADNLQRIVDGEDYTADKDALELIAQHAVGGMRDAITTLEQLAAFTGGKIAVTDVEELIGQADEETVFELSKAIAARDAAACFGVAAQLADSGADIAHFVKEFTAHIRDLYVVSVAGGAEGIVDVDAKGITRLQALVKAYGDSDRLARTLEILGDLSRELRDATDPRLRLEIAFTRLARPESDITLEALAERIRMLEVGGVHAGRPAAAPTPAFGGSAAAMVREVEEPAPVPAAKPAVPEPETMPPAPAPAKKAAPMTAPASEPTPVEPAGATSPTTTVPAGGLDIAAARRGWESAKASMKQAKPSRAAMFSTTSVDIAPDGTLLIVFPSDQTFGANQVNNKADFKAFVGEALEAVFGRRVAFQATATGNPVVIPDYPMPAMTPQAVEALDAPEPVDDGAADYVPAEAMAASTPTSVVEETKAAARPGPVPEHIPVESMSFLEDPADEEESEEEEEPDPADGGVSDLLASAFGAGVVVEEIEAPVVIEEPTPEEPAD